MSHAGDAYVIEMDIRGVRPDEVTATIEGSMLRICGARCAPNAHGEGRMSVEDHIGSFSWTVTLPDDADGDAATAILRHAVLKITVPKRCIESRRKIRVAIMTDE